MMLSLLSVLGLTLPLLAGAPQEVQAVVTANNQFAVELHNQLRRDDGNLFFSPYSINKTLAMVYAGARGDTAGEMAAVLHYTLGPDRQHQAFRETRGLLNGSRGGMAGFLPALRDKHDVQLYLSANLWGQRGHAFQKGFLDLLRDCYGAGLEEVDFTASEQAARTINSWVDKQTNHKIPTLFTPDAFDLNTRLVLASAIYFKGDWVHAFDRDRTRDEPFHLSPQKTAAVPMMHQTARLGYFEDEQLQGLLLPYEGRNLAMLVLLPKRVDGLADLEKTLSATKLAALMGQANEQKVDVSLPRFRLTGAFELRDPLTALGMKKVFHSGEADLGGMDGGQEGLFVSAVTHKAFVEVNEEGTEAAAATGAVVTTLAAAPPAMVAFRADHPFMFAICDVQTGLILFLGRMVQP
jgi:serpin B